MEITSSKAAPPPVDFSQVALPGALVSNAWPQARSTEGATLRAIEEVLTHYPLFEGFQTLDVPYPAERRAIGLLLAGRKRPHTYTLTRLLTEHQVNLSSLDPDNRRRAVAIATACFDDAAEAGAGIVGFISGPRPADPAQRPAALAALEDSLTQLATAAAAHHPNLELVIEPLDYEAHKRNTLGTTAEAVTICCRLAAKNLRLALCLDTSHLLLNEEDPVAAAGLARGFIPEFHFCNPVKDRASPLYGDQHPPFGAPGVVGVEEVATIMAGLHRAGYLTAAMRPRVYAEVLKPAHLDSLAVIGHCQDTLLSGWARTRQLLAS